MLAWLPPSQRRAASARIGTPDHHHPNYQGDGGKGGRETLPTYRAEGSRRPRPSGKSRLGRPDTTHRKGSPSSYRVPSSRVGRGLKAARPPGKLTPRSPQPSRAGLARASRGARRPAGDVALRLPLAGSRPVLADDPPEAPEES